MAARSGGYAVPLRTRLPDRFLEVHVLATPLGHGLAGIAVGAFGRGSVPPWRWYLFAAVAGNAADLDLLPGLLVGDINRFHQLASHSLLAAVLFGAGVALVLWRRRAAATRFGFVAGVMYATHLLLDLFTRDARAPFGLPLLWPFSSQHFIVPWPLFGGVRHGVPGDGLGTVVGEILSWENLGQLGMEALVLGPVVLVCWRIAAARVGRAVGPVSDATMTPAESSAE